MRKFLTILLFALSSAASATGQEQCTSSTAGSLQCMSGKQCECKLFPTSLMKNDPGGYRWDCGILRGSCLDLNKISDRGDAQPYNGPAAVYIERNQTSETTETTNETETEETTTP